MESSAERSNIKALVSAQWWAQCHAQLPKVGKEFQHPPRIELKSPDPLQFALTTEPWLRIDVQIKMVYNSSYLATWNPFFACRIVILWLLRLNMKARFYIPEFLNASWNIKSFHFVQFLLHAHWAAHQLWKSENWKLEIWDFKIDLWMVDQKRSRWLFTKADCSKNLQIKNRSLSCQHWSLHGFQTLHFIR